MKKSLLMLLAVLAGSIASLAQVVITGQPTNQTVLTGGNAAFSVMVTGVGPLTYQWQLNGVNLQNTINTFAGDGNFVPSGDGGQAAAAGIEPSDVAMDAVGNLFMADVQNRIREVAPSGIISTAGGGLYDPQGLAFDLLGNLYIADTYNNRITRMDTNGAMTIVAGIGPSFPSGGAYAGDGGPATNASLNFPDGVLFDASNNLYIVDTSNHRIRKVDASGIIISIAGDAPAGPPYLDAGSYTGDGGAATSAGLNSPMGATFDSFGNLYIADSGNNCVRKVDTSNVITTIAGNGTAGYSGDGGAATNALLNSPASVVCDACGNLYVADLGNNCVRRVDTGGYISTVVGNGSKGFAGDGGAATNASLARTRGLAFDQSGDLFLVDSGNYRVRKVHVTDTATLALGNINNYNAGSYSVVVSSQSGSVTSSAAMLIIASNPPAILAQPANQAASFGSNVTFNLAATGTPPLAYAWYFGGTTNLIQNGPNAALVVSNVSLANAGQYYVVVTNGYGSVTSQLATLGFSPAFTAAPVSQADIAGTTFAWNVSVAGVGPFTFQWQFNGTNLPNNVITTVAGNGNGQYAGDGGLATNASIFNATGVAADSQGNILIADRYSHRVRRVNTNGIILTVAGTNGGGFAGDGGAAGVARLNTPFGVTLDAEGNYFIADTGNNRIRKVDNNGIITTVAGNGTAGYGGDGAAATNAVLNAPHAVVVDRFGNLFIADTSNNRIRRVDANGVITTLAGTNAAGFAGDGGLAVNARLAGPQGVAVDGAGNVFIGDCNNNCIRRVDATGIITTFAGTNSSGFAGDGGAATSARLSSPAGLAMDASGNLFIADANNYRVRQVSPNGSITTVAGSGATGYSGDGGAATNAGLYQLYGVAIESTGSLLIADTQHSRIRRATLGRISTLPFNSVSTNNAGNYQVIVSSPYGSVTGSVVALAVVFVPAITVPPQSLAVSNGAAASLGVTAGGTAPLNYQWYQNGSLMPGATNATLNFPAVVGAQGGNYFCIITNSYGSVTSGGVVLTVLTPPTIVAPPASQVLVAGSSTTMSVTVSGTGPFTYQWQLNGTNLPNKNNIITRVAGVSTQVGFGGDGGLATNAVMARVTGLAFDPAGNLVIVDQQNNRVRRVDTSGIIKTIAGIGPSSTGGTYSGDGGAATNAGLNLDSTATPSGVAVDAAGNIYIADTDNSRIRKVDTNGIISTIAGTNSAGFSGDGGLAAGAKLNGPAGVAVDAAGNVFFADTVNNRVRKIGVNGIITTVAGTNGAGYSGDGGMATNANLNSPYGIAVDAGGNLFIADKGNNRIRKVDASGLISTFVGNGTAGYGGDNGLATNALLNQPYGVAVDAFGDVFVADYGNNRVRMATITGMITTVAGTGAGGSSGDGGSATNATLFETGSVGTDAYGNFFVGGSYSPTVRKVDLGRVPTLLLTNLALVGTGNYDVMVTSPYGSVTSSNALLTLLYPPSVTVQPAFRKVVAGSSTNLSVTVSGTGPFGYQWFTSSGRTATAVPYMLGGIIISAYMTDIGAGYVSTPQVHFVGGSGNGAAATALFQLGSVVAITMTSYGAGYTLTPPAIQIDPPPVINTPMVNQTGAVLPLPAVSSRDATNYFVVVTNSYGSVTSAVVFLTVFVPPQNFSIRNVVTGLQVNLSGTPVFPYFLQTATNLSPPVGWKSIYTNYTDASGNWQFTDTNLNAGPRFYRAGGQ